MSKAFRRTFLAGFFICLPLMVTVWTVRLVLGALQEALEPLVVEAMKLFVPTAPPFTRGVGMMAPALSLVLGVALVWLVGLLGGNVVGRQLLLFMEQLVLRVPVIRTIYGATRQFIDAFANGTGRSFSRVVLVQYPRQGVWTLGLVTNTQVGEVGRKLGEGLISVFLPTTPNPTSGWLAFVYERDVLDLSMSVDEAFRLIVSGGVLSQPNVAPSSCAHPLPQQATGPISSF